MTFCRERRCDELVKARGLCAKHYQRWWGENPQLATHWNLVEAPEAVVELFRRIAGDGTTDERCRRILDVCAPLWWGAPAKQQAMTSLEAQRLRQEREAIRQAWGDHQDWMDQRRREQAA